MSTSNPDQIALLFRRAYQAVIDETAIVADASPMELQPELRQSARWRNRPAVIVGAVFLAIVVAVGSASLVRHGEGTHFIAGAEVAHYPVLGDVESILGQGAQLSRVSTSLASVDASPTYMVAWAQESQGGYARAVVYLSAPVGGDLARGYVALEGQQTAATTPSGTDFTVTAATQSSPGGIEWTDGQHELLLFGYGITTDELLAGAEVMSTSGVLPEEWAGQLPRIYEGAPMLNPPNGIEMREATYQSADELRQIDVYSLDRWPDAEMATLLRSPNAHTVSIAGGDAVVSTDGEDHTRTVLLWNGTDGAVGGLGGVGVTVEELIAASSHLTDSPSTYAAADFDLGYEPVGESKVLMSGADWEYVGQEVMMGGSSGVCTWIAIDGAPRRDSVHCAVSSSSHEASFGTKADVEGGRLFVGWASSIHGVRLTMGDGTTVHVDTARFPGFEEPSYFAYVIPWGSRAAIITFLDANGQVVFDEPAE